MVKTFLSKSVFTYDELKMHSKLLIKKKEQIKTNWKVNAMIGTSDALVTNTWYL